MSGVALMRAMAHNNAWANFRLLSSCKALTEEEFDAPRTGFFGSIARTLNHIVTVDWFYVDALEGGSLGLAAFDPECPYPSADALWTEQAKADNRLIEVCGRLNDDTLGDIIKIQRGSHIQEERTDRLLLHLFQHQIHHRGQVHAMLSGTGVPPPQLDEFFPAADADLRAADFRDLGWTEAVTVTV